MTIIDSWMNPATGATATILGYREDLEEFPHDLYSYFLSSIRELDIANVRLLWRWIQGAQREYESLYGKILSLPLLLSPDYCPEAYLDYLKEIVGITDDVNYLWGVLDTNEKRRLIKYFVRFLLYRSTPIGIIEMIENMTGKNVEVKDFFDMRWIISGDTEMETAIGRLDEKASDPNLLTEFTNTISEVPDTVSLVTISGNVHYQFVLNSLIINHPDYARLFDTLEPFGRMPKFVRLYYRPTSGSIIVPLTLMGEGVVARTPKDYYFGQDSSSLSINKDDFRVGWDCDPYVFDINVDDADDTLNHAAVEAMAKFFRPLSERIYIRYYKHIEKFENEDNWTLLEGTCVFDNDEKIIYLGGVNYSRYRLIVDGSSTWESYVIVVKASINEDDKFFEIRWNVADDDNYLYWQVTPGIPPTLPAGAYEYGKCVGGVRVASAAGFIDQLDSDVDYVWRIVCLDGRVEPDLTTRMIIEVYQDENRVYNAYVNITDEPQTGTVELVSEAGTEVVVKELKTHSFPMTSVYVGL